MSATGDNAKPITLAADKEAERAFAPAPEDLEGRLLLQDRGYEQRATFIAARALGLRLVRARERGLESAAFAELGKGSRLVHDPLSRARALTRTPCSRNQRSARSRKRTAVAPCAEKASEAIAVDVVVEQHHDVLNRGAHVVHPVRSDEIKLRLKGPRGWLLKNTAHDVLASPRLYPRNQASVAPPDSLEQVRHRFGPSDHVGRQQ